MSDNLTDAELVERVARDVMGWTVTSRGINNSIFYSLGNDPARFPELVVAFLCEREKGEGE